MQVFRLVEPGRVDRIIAFDELPKRLLTGVRKGTIEGFARHWWEFFKIDKTAKDPKPFYFLEHTMLNSDKERWQEICNYVRSATDKKVRLLDKIEEMAIPMAPDSYSQITVEPEDITDHALIPIQAEEEEVVKPVKVEKKEEPLINTETITVVKKKAGRPKKHLVTV